MSNEHIKIPDGMMQAVDKAVGKFRAKQVPSLVNNYGELWPNDVMRISIEAALCWLYDEMDGLERKPYNDLLAHEYNACIADVRRMFRAPDDEFPEDGTV